MEKERIDSVVRSLVVHTDSLEEVAAFQPEVERQLEVVGWAADCIVLLQGREHICLTVEH